jgi:hypothetical protein
MELKGDIMRNRTMSSKAAAIAVVLTALAFATAGADVRVKGPSARRLAPFPRGTGFNVSGRFSGALSGDVMLDGVTYHLTDRTVVYELGRGPVKLGETVTDRFIFLSGSRNGGYEAVYSVIIRPLTDSTDPVREPTVLDPSAPQ